MRPTGSVVKWSPGDAGFKLERTTVSPIKGAKGNTELLAHLVPAPKPPPR